MLLSKFLAVLAFLEALELLLSKRYIKSSFSNKGGLGYESTVSSAETLVELRENCRKCSS